MAPSLRLLLVGAHTDAAARLLETLKRSSVPVETRWAQTAGEVSESRQSLPDLILCTDADLATVEADLLRILSRLAAARAARPDEQTRVFEQVRAGRARAQLLSQQLLEAQEAERRHLARELHDEIGQALTAVKINLQALERASADSAGRLSDSIAIVDRALQQVRNLSLDLRPSLLDDLGLVAALRWYLDRQGQRAGLATEFVSQPAEIRGDANVETACFRVAQEALTNIVRHAQARRAKLELRQRDAELELTVSDDGIGFDVAAARQRAARGGSLGLLGMQERVLLMGGRIDIQSTRGKGTRLVACLPIAPAPALERRSRRRS
jgi:signal transduction histidine kinase